MFTKIDSLEDASTTRGTLAMFPVSNPTFRKRESWGNDWMSLDGCSQGCYLLTFPTGLQIQAGFAHMCHFCTCAWPQSISKQDGIESGQAQPRFPLPVCPNQQNTTSGCTTINTHWCQPFILMGNEQFSIHLPSKGRRKRCRFESWESAVLGFLRHIYYL